MYIFIICIYILIKNIFIYRILINIYIFRSCSHILEKFFTLEHFVLIVFDILTSSTWCCWSFLIGLFAT